MNQQTFTNYQQPQQQQNTTANTINKVLDFGNLVCNAGKTGVDIITGAYDSRRNNNFNPTGYMPNYGMPNGTVYNGCPYPYIETQPQQNQFFGCSTNNTNPNFYNGSQQNQMYPQVNTSGYPGFWNPMYGK